MAGVAIAGSELRAFFEETGISFLACSFDLRHLPDTQTTRKAVRHPKCLPIQEKGMGSSHNRPQLYSRFRSQVCLDRPFVQKKNRFTPLLPKDSGPFRQTP